MKAKRKKEEKESKSLDGNFIVVWCSIKVFDEEMGGIGEEFIGKGLARDPS